MRVRRDRRTSRVASVCFGLSALIASLAITGGLSLALAACGAPPPDAPRRPSAESLVVREPAPMSTWACAQGSEREGNAILRGGDIVTLGPGVVRSIAPGADHCHEQPLPCGVDLHVVASRPLALANPHLGYAALVDLSAAPVVVDTVRLPGPDERALVLRGYRSQPLIVSTLALYLRSPAGVWARTPLAQTFDPPSVVAAVSGDTVFLGGRWRGNLHSLRLDAGEWTFEQSGATTALEVSDTPGCIFAAHWGYFRLVGDVVHLCRAPNRATARVLAAPAERTRALLTIRGTLFATPDLPVLHDLGSANVASVPATVDKRCDGDVEVAHFESGVVRVHTGKPSSNQRRGGHVTLLNSRTKEPDLP